MFRRFYILNIVKLFGAKQYQMRMRKKNLNGRAKIKNFRIGKKNYVFFDDILKYLLGRLSGAQGNRIKISKNLKD